MNKEKSEEQEKHTEGDRITDLLQMFPSYYALAPGEQREPVKERVDQENVTDCQTATYWG
ncbi:MAG: hypothetical protein ACOYOS_21025 [Syntrophales bacterium]